MMAERAWIDVFLPFRLGPVGGAGSAWQFGVPPESGQGQFDA
jgi:hypothetical protein